ncbi:DNA topoisomerase I [Candidatus Roizmanbacteria bacterium RIFCSPHIGHO2_02_FULL_37_13b]|uniref:DNA topoisomerase 1 n=1 Tax=Candidatus Roizmanbacteria bacterium RIFCSPLOWO2_02_FULL_36_11 TaxID=1802071 RepID=A0A1F7JHY5_9BACT|nr:MAG: DNA topoisomerase I [Candidatus Roizmanbacteria bacterium RIFCSPHIGHO2_02_FULL_37_13b]OGK55234.1 MAG: DNA topoisomerase I [Candidatus Roizmanbacteria bacterium RIFCSPLOWO2_02_FULL_36_11]
MDLIIVESPTKAKTISNFLKNKSYEVVATLGHIRDLPENKIGVDIKNKYNPQYIISTSKRKSINDLKNKAKHAKTIILATDSDREGEAISYHVAYLLGFVKEKWPKSEIKHTERLKRIVFHEITKSAFETSINNPQSINLNLVDAQQCRRILDRLVGYTLSPLLWKKVGKGWLSAGRVQTVALRFIVEREKEILAFERNKFYKVLADFITGSKKILSSRLVSYKGEKYEKKFVISLFDGDYTYTQTSVTNKNKDDINNDLEEDKYRVLDIIETITKRYPSPPYTTSTLQQDAARKLGYSSKMTMRLAQNLYERGIITYHRTDSFFMSDSFLKNVHKFIISEYGLKYQLDKFRIYKTKSKLAQEAHEAIRPTQLILNLDVAKYDLNSSHVKLYKLIFLRAVASQMKEAEIKQTRVKIISNKEYLFETEYEQIVFDGFLKIYGLDDKKNGGVQSLKINDNLILNILNFNETETQPPPRYNEASLIKTLEEKGIGRPSTFAPTVSVIQERNYTEKKEGRFYPTLLGTKISDYLSKAFNVFFTVDFTAKMENELDTIADGKKQIIEILDHYYTPFSKLLEIEKNDKTYIDVEEKANEPCPKCGKDLVFRFSKYGKFYACSGYPKCKFTKPFYEVASLPCPKCNGKILIKYTRRKRKFYGCSNYPKCDFAAWRLDQIPTQTKAIL